MNGGNCWSIRASYILPGDGLTIRDGVMRCRGGLIEAVGPAAQVLPAPDHRILPQDWAILPGLVNAHTHLELSHLRGLLPRKASMPRWLLALLKKRATPQIRQQAVAAGADEALRTGTTSLADISHDNSAWKVLQNHPIRKLCFAEALGIGPLQAEALPRLIKSLEALPPADELLQFGISPHAPYTTAQAVYQQCVALAQERGWPVCTHLAESRGERHFLAKGGGAFMSFLKKRGLAGEADLPRACKPLEFAQRVGLLPPKENQNAPVILAHVNFIDDDELAMLAASNASVVYCPGSSDFFGRSGHRYSDMLRAGINVAIGTDSLASNSALDMLGEMRILRRQGQLDDQTILRMATGNGARALGWQDRVGCLQGGKSADYIAVRLPASGMDDPLRTILENPCPVVQTVIAGKARFHLVEG